MEARDTGHPGPTGVSLRDFPYPYAAALTITGDPDDLRTATDFERLVRFLNAGDRTPLGPGLSLDLSHSFWFYDACGECEFTVFRGASSELSPHADLIAEMIRTGHLDTMHTYGNFSEGGFERRHAERALAFLRERGLSVPVWVNHGGTGNTQTVGNLPWQRGDDPGLPEYHTDLMAECGVRFVERFGVTHIVGQDARSTPRDRVVQLAESARYLMARDRARAYGPLRNELLSPCVLGDGLRVLCFTRFIGRERGLARAGSPELALQLAPSVLEELIAKRGWMAVYTHPWRGGGASLIDPQAVEALRNLERQARRGRILVTRTSAVLKLNLVSRGLAWSSGEEGGALTVRIDHVEDDAAGRWVPEPHDLCGITFYTPEPERTRILIGDHELGDVVANPPDESGSPSVSVPLRRLRPPPLPSR